LARRALPNEPLVLVLAGYIDRRQGRWEQSIEEMERALELDPRNLFILQQISFNYENLRRYKEMAATLDRVLTIAPKDINTRVQRTLVDLEARADLRAMHSAVQEILTENPEGTPALTGKRATLALCERNDAAASRVLVALVSE